MCQDQAHNVVHVSSTQQPDLNDQRATTQRYVTIRYFFLAGMSEVTPAAAGESAAATTATLYDANPSMAVMRIDSWCTSSSAPLASAKC